MFIVVVVWCLLTYGIVFLYFGFNSVGIRVLYYMVLFVVIALFGFWCLLVYGVVWNVLCLLLAWLVGVSCLFDLCCLMLVACCFAVGLLV